ncbi:MAG: hypothetical protein WCL32_14370, partial [Planctomycetota bacterium]
MMSFRKALALSVLVALGMIAVPGVGRAQFAFGGGLNGNLNRTGGFGGSIIGNIGFAGSGNTYRSPMPYIPAAVPSQNTSLNPRSVTTIQSVNTSYLGSSGGQQGQLGGQQIG